jgi:hypothetical protein
MAVAVTCRSVSGSTRTISRGASFSPQRHVGVGAIYSRLLGDAAASPVTALRGSEDQLFAGVAIIYAS